MFDRLRAAARGDQNQTQSTDANAGLRVIPNSDGRVVAQAPASQDGRVVSQEWNRNGMTTPTPPNREGLMVLPNRAGGVASEEWYQNGQPRPGGVKAAAAAAAAKAAEPKATKTKTADRGDER